MPHPRALLIAFLLATLCPLAVFAADAPAFNYAEALQKAIFFYDCQRSGKLPPDNRVCWRGDSGLTDGADVGHDLTGGMYDAGDNVKFNFPMAFTATMLAWSAQVNHDAYVKSGQLPYLLANIKWITDYLIKCHTAPNELYAQVGDGNIDHAWWGPAECMQMKRPSYKIDATHPGSDYAGEVAAAMAAASIVFKDTDPEYAATLLEQSKQIYNFAETYKGSYSDSIPQVQSFYKSWSGYQDELTWGAIWLYKATGEDDYLKRAEDYYQTMNIDQQTKDHGFVWTVGWDDKSYGCYVLLAQITGKAQYFADAERNLDFWTVGVDGRQVHYTPGGLAWLDTWGSLRYAANAAFLAFVYSDIVTDPAKKARYHDFAVKQINYMLGDNPQHRSFEVGFDVNPPHNVHHRTAHCSWTDNIQDPVNERHTIYGALVGGPDGNDNYQDNRSDYTSNEVACDYNAGFTACLARMTQEYGGTALADFPQPEKKDIEFGVEASINSSGRNYTEVRLLIFNKSGWPARVTTDLTCRYFLDLTEVIKAGYTPRDVRVTMNYNQGAKASSLLPWDAAKNLYYVEVSFPGVAIYPGGQDAYHKEAQVRFSLPDNAKDGAWDSSNDPSYQGIATGYPPTLNPNIPVYENGVFLEGIEPTGGVPGGPASPLAMAAGDGGPPATPPTPPTPVTPIVVPTPPTPPVTTLVGPPPEPPVVGDVQVYYRAADTNAADNQIKPVLKIVNAGTEDIPLNELTVRYWFTDEGEKPLNYWCDWAQMGGQNITGAFHTVVPAAAGADTYLELSFTAGTLPAGGDSGEIQNRFSKTDWSNFNQSDDFSFDPSKTAFAPWDHVTLYRNGVLIWGVEPGPKVG